MSKNNSINSPMRKSPRFLGPPTSPKVGPIPNFNLLTQTPVKKGGREKQDSDDEGLFQNPLQNEIRTKILNDLCNVGPTIFEIKSTPRNDSKRKRKETSTSKSKKVTDDSNFEEEIEHPEAKKSKVEKGGAVKKTKVEKGETSKKKKVKKGETSKRKKVEKCETSKRKKVEKCETSKRKKVEKGETSKRKKNNPTKKTQTHWCSYTNVEAPLEVKDRLNDAQLKLFRESPFGLFLDLPKLNVQPQLIRCLMYAETEHDRHDMFIINLNGKELHFGIREFAIVTGLKCGMDSEFVSDPDSPNRLMDMYFNGLTKVPKNDLIELFHDKKRKLGMLMLLR
ncbi:stress response protein NST1-like [Lycium barbarum]|uniref:stress response protein NST1-like n=1 Tax=Lycium barbarum TaxID=112863 RepID=UPI00293F1FEA|nr:stress response protein NST1-like [Lycium barbarum]